MGYGLQHAAFIFYLDLLLPFPHSLSFRLAGYRICMATTLTIMADSR